MGIAAPDLPALGRLAKGLIGRELTRGQLESFARYAAELTAWNRRFNLTAITDPSEIEVKHFLDSMTCLLAMDDPGGSELVDVGTGAGFPGLVLKIACPELRVVLVESIGKKADFCRHMILTLGLQQAQVLQARAEVLGRQPEHRDRYQWGVARAVAPLAVLLEYLLPLLRLGGCVVAQKGESGPAEAQAAESAMQMLGGRLDRLLPLELPGVAETRYLVVVEKAAATPARYPRRAGVPARRPLA